MLNNNQLVRLNLHLRQDHLNRLTVLADGLARRKGRYTRLAEAIELVLTAGCVWSDYDLLDLARPDHEQPSWLALGIVARKHSINGGPITKRLNDESNRSGCSDAQRR